MIKGAGNKKGVTLIELMVACAILAVVMGAGFMILVTGMKNFGVNVNYSNSQAGLRTAMLKISREERKANNVTIVDGKLTFTIGTETNSYYIASGNWLMYDEEAIASNVKGISASVNEKIVAVTLTAADGTTLTTEMTIHPK